MNTKLRYLVIAIATSMSGSLWAQQTQDAAEESAEIIEVRGIRGSLVNSARLKESSSEIVDTITAEDVGKLPDPNVAETLTRIPGVQGYRYGGEGASPVGNGSGLTVRGLSGQTASRLDGRAYFTAGQREFNIESAIPGMISGIEVYKNPSAKHIEGAIGGLVDLHTRRPFDMQREVISVSAGMRYNDFAGSTTPDLFGLYSNNWDLENGGKIGFLFAGNIQETHNRSDSTPANRGASLRRAIRADDTDYLARGGDSNYAGRTDIWHLADPISTDSAPDLMTVIGQNAHVFEEDIYRERQGYNAAFQWAPNRDFMTYIEGNYNRYEYNQEYRFMIMNDSRTVQNLQTTDYDLTADLVTRGGSSSDVLATEALLSGTFLDSGFFTLGGNEDRPYETYLVATGFEWTINDSLQMDLDLSYVNSEQTQDNRNVRMNTSEGLTWDVYRELTGDVHDIAITGPDLTDPANYVFESYSNGTHRVNEDNGIALQTDFSYFLDGGFFKEIQFGARYATQEAEVRNYNFGGKYLTTDGQVLASDFSNAITASNMPGLIQNAPTDWVRNDTMFDGGYVTFRPSALPGNTVQENFSNAGIPSQNNLPENILTRRYAEEDTLAAYVMGDFSAMDDRIRGNIGVRVVNADTTTRAWVTDTSTGSAQTVAIDANSSTTDVLPSLNVIGELDDGLLLRFGYSKGITRPDLGSLSPTVTVETVSGTGSAGNPNLKPLKADSYDISLEKYFGDANYVSMAVFNKEIDGFINTIGSCETVATAPAYNGGVDNSCSNGQYFIEREVNAESGSARGVELAAQTFFDIFDESLKDFGVSASYTYVTTENPVEINGEIVDTPQAFQSDNSFSIAGLYESEGLSARVVYTYRSDFILFGVTDAPINGRYVKGYGIVDASLNYDINDTYTLSLTASNLTDEAPSRYVGEPGAGTTDFLNQYYVNGRNFGLTIRANFGG